MTWREGSSDQLGGAGCDHHRSGQRHRPRHRPLAGAGKRLVLNGRRVSPLAALSEHLGTAIADGSHGPGQRRGPFRFAYTLLRHFKAKDNGHLITISSILGTTVRAHAGAYAGTKHALEGLSHALRPQLARTNVRRTNTQPGLVLTDVHRHMERHPKEAPGIDEPLSPDDIARAVLFVLREPAHVQVNSVQLMQRVQEL